MAKITLADGMVIEGTAEELRELAKAFGEVAEAVEKEVTEFKVGDYAKITGAGDKPPYNSHNFPIGSIVKVDEVGDNECGDRFRGKRIDGVGHGWWVLNEYAVKASDEEVADALGEDAEETAPEPEETPQDVREGDYVVEETIKAGDLIRFTENFFGVKEGEIVEVVTGADIVGVIQYRDRDGEIWNAMPKRFELVAKKVDRRDLADRKDV